MSIESNHEMLHTIVDTWECFLEVKQYLDNYDSEILVIDTETDGVQEKTAKLFGIGICLSNYEAFYIPLRKNNESKDKWWTEDQENSIKEWFISLCKRKKTIGHNCIYDILVIYHNWGIDLTNCIYSDTILQKHLLDEERPFGLKEVAVKYLGDWANLAQQDLYSEIKANGGSTKKDNIEMWKASTETLGRYCAWDVLLTRKLFDIFEPRIIKEGLHDLFYKDEIMPLYKKVTIPMKKHGFPVDVPYFKDLNEQISHEISSLEQKIQKTISSDTEEFEQLTINENYPVKTTGNFPKLYAKMIGFPLPEKNGKITLAAKEIDKLDISDCPQKNFNEWHDYLSWLKGEDIKLPETWAKVQRYWYRIDNPNSPYIFNLNSNDHLKWLFFDHYQEQSLSTTEKGEPQVDEEFLDSMVDIYSWVQLLIDYKKLQKLKSTYIEGVLERHIDGVIYSSFIQFGPPSGRYASRDPNLQNLPRVKEDDSGLSELVLKYVNSIKRGFIATEGYTIVNADYSQLEPRAFAEACEDYLLQQVFHKNEDLYGSIAKNIWNLDCLPNEVKKKYPEKRQMAKVIALAVVYGAEAGRISQLMNIDWSTANDIIRDYLEAYPGLKQYMNKCNEEVCTTGMVRTKFGRIRHLPEAKRLYNSFGLKLLDKKWSKAKGLDDLRWKFKNMLNLAKNYKIQGVAAHVVNRSAIAINKEFKYNNINGVIVAQVHDELTCIVPKDKAEQARSIVKRCMENTIKLSVPLKAEPLIATNWAEAK